MTEWEIGARITARMLVEARDRMYRQERDLRAAARAAGHDIDTRIQYAEGSAAAYTIACSILSGALGFPTIEELAGEWERPRDVLRPILPDADAVAFVPGDVIAAASVRMGGSDK